MNNHIYSEENIRSESEQQLTMAEAAESMTDCMLNHYIPLNYWAVQALGIDAALVLACLYDVEAKRLYKYGPFTEFTVSIASMKRWTGLSAERQRRAIKVLTDMKIVKYWTRGLPSKRCFRFNEYFDYDGLKAVIRGRDFSALAKTVHDGPTDSLPF